MNSRKNSKKLWGLYSLAPEAPVAIPLKSLDINVQIVHNTARVFYTQVYLNESEKYLETEFFFPISPDACFDSFEAKFQDHVIKGVVKKKEQAQEEYKEAIAKGRTAAYSEINEATGDIMKVMIGNIPPKTDISIQYSYIEKLEISLNKFWCYRLFSTITPRYNSNPNQLANQDISLLASYPLVSSKSNQAYPWTIKVDIQSPSPISLLQSPTHQIVTEYGNEKHTCTITLDSSSVHHPNKDFVILYSNGKEDEKVDCVITPFDEGYCAMISVLADFEQKSAADAYQHFVKKETVKSEHSMKTVRGEYIFLIDRSGSMDGERMEMAKKSLVLFLKSLPMDSYCNVISFGGNYHFSHNTSIASSPESLQNLISQVNLFSADMGGTEIYEPLRQAFKLPMRKGYPRNVFLLTDGDVSNTQSVLDLIKNNSDKSKVFTIGIGNGCSPELITKGALYGMGKHQFVTENKTIFEKVIDLLNASLSPCYSELSLEGENFDAMVKSISPNPTTIPFLINGQTVTLFLILRDGIFNNDSQKMEFKLKMYDTRIGSFRTIPFSLNKEDVMQNDSIPKLAVHDMMKRLEMVSQEGDQKVWWLDQQNEINETLLNLSLKYGILCKKTAFFCEVKENDEITSIKPTDKTKAVVPALVSVDYSCSESGEEIECYEDEDDCCDYDDDDLNQKKVVDLGKRIKQINEASAQILSSLQMQNECLMSLEEKVDTVKDSSASFKKKAKSPGFFGGMVNKISNVFSSESKKKAEIEPAYHQQPTVQKSANSFAVAEEGKFFSAPSIQSKKKASSDNSYLDIIMRQNFDGSWDPTDHQLAKEIAKGGKLPEAPQEIKQISQGNVNAIWITLLVLVWLETNWKSEEGAWSLIYKKGIEWLKSQGADYATLKEKGMSVIQN